MNTYQQTVRRIAVTLSQSKPVAAKLALVLFVSVCGPFMPVAEQPAGLSPDAPAYEENVSYHTEIKDATSPGDRQTVVYGDALLDAGSGCDLLFLRLQLNILKGNTLCKRLCTESTDYRMFFISRR